MEANELRQKYIDFMVAHGYVQVKPVGLILEGDSTTLFTSSGMQPMVPYLLGEKHPSGTLITNSQPCIRAQDMEEVGDNRHTTFFEMLGDWSLNGLNKKQQIEWLFEFLTIDLKLDPNRLYVSCFIGDKKNNIPRDDESADAWAGVFKKHNIEAKSVEIGSSENGDKRGMKPGERIFFYDDGQNWWSRNGGIDSTPIGDPCGPDSEVFFDHGEETHDPSFGLAHPASDGGRFVEICNKVWMQYKRLNDGGFEPLETGKVDFGGGLSRLLAAVNDTSDMFLTDLYQPIIRELEKLTGKKYEDNTEAMRIVADHLTGAVWLASQNLVPSNKEQGYVMRRLLRRSILKALDLGIEENFLGQLISIIAGIYDEAYPEIGKNAKKVADILENEEKTFRKTLNRGLRVFQRFSEAGLTGKELFMLHDTFGFPLELSIEEADKRKIKLSDDWQTEFNQAMTEQRERSKTATKGMFKGGLEDAGEMTVKYHTTAHLLLSALHKVLSPDVEQKGANITAERLRFDFSWPEKLTPEQIVTIENQVNEWILADLPVAHDEYDTDYALGELHAHGSFREKYGDKVTVYSIDDISREVCGGPHVERTGLLGKFKITKEESSSAGVRRIKAILE